MQQAIQIQKILNDKPIDNEIVVNGWVRTRRDSKGNFSFLEINDGSCLANLQVICDGNLSNYEEEIKKLSTGCAVEIFGSLVDSPAKGQEVELHAKRLKVHGWAPAETYPLQKKRHSFEFLRSIAHLRPRTNSLSAVARIRSRLSQAIHTFFEEQGFFYIHTPIITTSDCEGAGEMFTVTNFNLEKVPKCDGKVAYEDDFFGGRAGLTVSGQLQAEIYAMALGRVYTFGPTFRAENSNTSRHLSEFWMIEPEMAFCDLDCDMAMAEKFLRFLVQITLDTCKEDLELFAKFVDKGLYKKLESVVASDFVKITYSEAIRKLQKAKQNFEYPVAWGTDLQSEHERYLTEQVYKKPVIVFDYPKTIKPFYMRCNDDDKTVAAMDILFPGIGEIVGGSQREERYDVLLHRMNTLGMEQKDYEWYLDLRRYGSAPHAGFGVGFERIIQFITGMANIREVIPFPRTPGSADF